MTNAELDVSESDIYNVSLLRSEYYPKKDLLRFDNAAIIPSALIS
jgi:hypothetical protein